MPAEGLPDRVRRVAGREALDGIDRFDAANDLHVDQAAGHLLRRLQVDNEPEAFEVLIDLCQERLSAVAEDVAAELGLAMDPDDLVVAYFTRLYTDVRPRRDGTRHFLADAAAGLRAEAESWIRDLALMDVPATSTARDDLTDLTLEPSLDAIGKRYAEIVKVCYHRLDVRYRRILRAKDVKRLSSEEIAVALDMPIDDVEPLLREARLRLADVIAAATGGNEP